MGPTIAFIAIAFACAGCREFTTTPLPPDLPDGAQAIDAPADYGVWWSATEQCAGRTAAMSRVQWFTMPGRTSFMYGDGQYDGYWWNDVHWILLAGDKVQNGMIVRHEMLHDLLQTGEHPAAFETCGVRGTRVAEPGLAGPEVQRNDRRAPVQVQHR